MTNPAIYLRGVLHKDIKNIVEFMYVGEVNVAQEDLDSFLAAAQDLCIKGLTQPESSKKEPQPEIEAPPPAKRAKSMTKPAAKKEPLEPLEPLEPIEMTPQEAETFDQYYEHDGNGIEDGKGKKK